VPDGTGVVALRCVSGCAGGGRLSVRRRDPCKRTGERPMTREHSNDVEQDWQGGAEAVAPLDVPWVAVAEGEPAALMAAYRQARTVVDELRAGLVAAGLRPWDSRGCARGWTRPGGRWWSSARSACGRLDGSLSWFAACRTLPHPAGRRGPPEGAGPAGEAANRRASCPPRVSGCRGQRHKRSLGYSADRTGLTAWTSGGRGRASTTRGRLASSSRGSRLTPTAWTTTPAALRDLHGWWAACGGGARARRWTHG
jgi:hypothetical protein